ncbi:MAG: relaxase/mobilization nuclease domain-containing protein, partial [Desulfovibrio sp.]|nr:relaxase/mobilization nuclease domain-containing protein [Desulfovibrio sp.]
LHGNSANLHLHIAVNRTNPDTLKVIQPHRGFDIEEAHRIVALLEHRQGWAGESKPRYTVNDRGEIVRRQSKPVSKPRNEAANFESATGEKSAQRIAQERGHSVIKNAASWAELHTGLANAGLRFEKKSSGAIVFVGNIAVKASSVDRNFGMGKLCKRLGEFEPGNYAPEMKALEPEPVSDVALDEWREYRKFRAEEAENRRMAQRRTADALAQVRKRQRAERAAAVNALARHGLHILNIARHFLMLQQRKELARLRAADPPTPRKRLRIFKRWLGERDPWLASLWRLRRRIFYGMNVKPFQFPKIGDMASPYSAYREIMAKRFPEKMDASRLDAAVALRMRLAGYTRAEVANEMYRKARPLRKESRDWKEYAHRTVWYAFGAAGDVDIADFKPALENILSFHQEAERLEEARLATEQATESEGILNRPRMR